jgi:heavy metal translocating P-type ATPase
LIFTGWDDFLLTFFACIATFPVLVRALKSIKEKKISVDLLASIALVISLLNKEWASAAFINLMLTSARIFTVYTDNKAKSAIKSLLKLKPQHVMVKKGNGIVKESISKIKKGDLIVIELGERIPVDGVVVSGQAEIDQSSLTGESLPVSKKTGDEVLSSTLNLAGSIIIRAEKVGKDTAFEKIIRLVEASQRNKIGILTTVDKFTSFYILITLIGAIALYLITYNLNLILTVLLVTCADDIAVAVPMAFAASLSTAAKRGIIIKGGAFLEGLTKVKTFVFDKTGTITKGKLKVDRVYSFSDYSGEAIVKYASMADFFSEHPVARAVIDYAAKNKLRYTRPTDFKEFPGNGSLAKFHGQTISCGKIKFLIEQGVKISDEEIKKIDEINAPGANSVLAVGLDGKLIGLIALIDEIRPEAKSAIAELKLMGVKHFIMLTGDNEHAARKVADEVGITKFHANLLPGDKLEYIKKYLNKTYKVAMVGDGVNDAAALALADIGIAMGTIGIDAAIEAADIALMKDNFSKIPEVVALGRKTMRNTYQNFWLWGVINLVGLGLAFGKIVGPEGAAAFNFFTDFVPIFNSMRMFLYKPEK